MENLLPAGNGKFTGWTPTVTGSATVPVGTVSATSGPDSTPGDTLGATGTSGGIELVANVNCAAESALYVSCICKASSATPTLIPIQVTFQDAAGNTVVTATPYASAAAPTSFTYYSACLPVPVGAVKAQVILGALAWSSTGGYTNIVASPIVGGF